MTSGRAPSAIRQSRRPDVSPGVPAVAAATTRDVKLSLINGFGLTHGGAEVPVSINGQHLLAFLALSNRSVPRTQIAGALWADVPGNRAAGNLRSTLWRLRNLGLELVRSTRDCLSVSASVAVDVRVVERISRMVADASADISALDLDQLPLFGELLPGWGDEWVLLERERQRQISLHVLEALCARWTAERRFDRAVRAGLAAVAAEPLRESSNRVLVQAFLAEGNPTEALRRFIQYRDVLRRELRLEPSDRITELVVDLAQPVTTR